MNLVNGLFHVCNSSHTLSISNPSTISSLNGPKGFSLESWKLLYKPLSKDKKSFDFSSSATQKSSIGLEIADFKAVSRGEVSAIALTSRLLE